MQGEAGQVRRVVHWAPHIPNHFAQLSQQSTTRQSSGTEVLLFESTQKPNSVHSLCRPALRAVCKDFEAANVTCFDWFPGPDRALQFAAGLNKGQVVVSYFEPVASSFAEVGTRGARSIVLQHSQTRRRACNDVAWNPCQDNLLAVALEKLPNETSLHVWDIVQASPNNALSQFLADTPASVEPALPVSEAGGALDQGSFTVLSQERLGLIKDESCTAVRWLPKSASVLVVGSTPGKNALDKSALRILDIRHPQGEVLQAARDNLSSSSARAQVGVGLLAIDPLATDLRRCATHSGEASDSVVKIWDLRRASEPLMQVTTPGVPKRLSFCPTGEGVLSALVSSSTGGPGAIHVWMLRSSDAHRECYQDQGGGKGAASGTGGGRGGDVKRPTGGGGWGGVASDELWSRRVETGDQVAALDWHPSHPGRLIAVGAGEIVHDFAVQFGGGVSFSPHGDLAGANTAGLFTVSCAQQAEAGNSLPGCWKDAAVRVEDDICDLMRERAMRGYVLDPSVNAEIARATKDDALARAWTLVGRLMQGADPNLVRGLEAVIQGDPPAAAIATGSAAAAASNAVRGELCPGGRGTRKILKKLLRGVTRIDGVQEGFARNQSVTRLGGMGGMTSSRSDMHLMSQTGGQSNSFADVAGVHLSPGGTPSVSGSFTPQRAVQTPGSKSSDGEAGGGDYSLHHTRSFDSTGGGSNGGGGSSSNGSEWLMMDVYVSEQRRSALKVCEYDMGVGFDDDGDFAGSETLEKRVTALERKFLFDQAAFVRLLQVDLSSAVECLNKGMVMVASDGASGAYAMASLALAGAAGSSLSVWKRAFRHALEQCKEPYLRVCFFLLARDFKSVLQEEGVAIEDRLACACRFLKDEALQAATTDLIASKMATGQLDGLLLTGLTPRAEPLLRRYVERTSDLQTAALLLCHFAAAPSLSAAARRSQHSAPWQESRRRTPLWEQWLDDYSDLLDRWQMWEHRAVLDIAMSAIAPRARPPEVHLACTSCGQPTTLAIKVEGQNGNKGEAQSGSHCRHCMAELPKCSVCLMPMGATNAPNQIGGVQFPRILQVDPTPFTSTQDSLCRPLYSRSQFDSWTSWCQQCNHGGHAGHLRDWFRDHTICPVAGCMCHCAAADVHLPAGFTGFRASA